MATFTKINLNSVEFVTQFIALYKELPCLWRLGSKDYTDTRKRKNAYKLLAELMRRFDNEATVDLVKAKINNMRSSYRKERHKVETSQRQATDPEDVHKPSLWYYPLLSFLPEQKRTTFDSDPQELISVTMGDEGRGGEEGSNCEENLELGENGSYVEYEYELHPLEDSQNSISRIETEKLYSENETRTVRKRKLEPDRTEELRMQQKGSKMIDRRSSGPEDECSAFAVVVAAKLKNMVPEQRDLAEVMISTILFRGLKGHLAEHHLQQLDFSSSSQQ